MNTEETQQKLETIRKRFIDRVNTARSVYQAEVEKIIKEANTEKETKIKQELGIE